MNNAVQGGQCDRVKLFESYNTPVRINPSSRAQLLNGLLSALDQMFCLLVTENRRKTSLRLLLLENNTAQLLMCVKVLRINGSSDE